jgi:hypothetical protein
MARKKPDSTATATPEAPKHHEMQQLVRVELIRGRTLRLMMSALGNLRTLLSAIPGNEEFVERLRGKSGEEILGRCCDFVMMELGDTATGRETGGDRSRAFSRKVKGAMGLSGEEQHVDEPQTAA